MTAYCMHSWPCSYMGKGVSKAVENINKVIAPAVVVSFCCQKFASCIGLHKQTQRFFLIMTGIEPGQPEGG